MTRSIGDGSHSDHMERAITEAEYPIAANLANDGSAPIGFYFIDPKTGVSRLLHMAGDLSAFPFNGGLTAFGYENGIVPAGRGEGISTSDIIMAGDSTFNQPELLSAGTEFVYVILSDGSSQAVVEAYDIETGQQKFASPPLPATTYFDGSGIASEADRLVVCSDQFTLILSTDDGSMVADIPAIFDGGFAAFPDGSFIGVDASNNEAKHFSADYGQAEWTLTPSDVDNGTLQTSNLNFQRVTIIDRERAAIAPSNGPPFIVNRSGEVEVRHLSNQHLGGSTAGFSKSPNGKILTGVHTAKGNEILSHGTESAEYATTVTRFEGSMLKMKAGPAVGDDPAAHGL